MAAIYLTLTFFDPDAAQGTMTGAAMTVEHEGGRHAEVTILNMPQSRDAHPYEGLRAELTHIAHALEAAPIVGTERPMTDVLTFRGQGTFEIKLQKPPKATAEGENVKVTLPVFAGGFPNGTAQMEMFLNIEEAEQLAAQLQPALTMARVRASG